MQTVPLPYPADHPLSETLKLHRTCNLSFQPCLPGSKFLPSTQWGDLYLVQTAISDRPLTGENSAVLVRTLRSQLWDQTWESVVSKSPTVSLSGLIQSSQCWPLTSELWGLRVRLVPRCGAFVSHSGLWPLEVGLPFPLGLGRQAGSRLQIPQSPRTEQDLVELVDQKLAELLL